MIRIALCITLTLTLGLMAGITDTGNFNLTRSTIDGGGVMSSAGGGYELSATIAQSDAGVRIGGDFRLTGGFWFEEPPGDCNSTGTVNLLDYADLEACLLGPDIGFGAGCQCFDTDFDGDNDLVDFAAFQVNFTGG